MNYKLISKAFWLIALFMLLLPLVQIVSSSIDTIEKDVLLGLLSIGALIGISVYRFLNNLHISYVENLEKVSREKNFELIFKNIGHLKFNKRIGDLIFFDYSEYSLVYNIKKQQFFVFREDECILTSQNISDSHVIISIKNHLHTEFSNVMNDCVIVNGVLYSRNLFQLNHNNNIRPFSGFAFQRNNLNTEPEEYDIDDILDKINNQGLDSLTEKELEFLKSQK